MRYPVRDNKRSIHAGFATLPISDEEEKRNSGVPRGGFFVLVSDSMKHTI
jgi:hypothetical protein